MPAKDATDLASVSPLILQTTGDGSLTFYSPTFGEAFHSHHGAKQEAEQKFVAPTRLQERALKGAPLKILDICYGLGHNTAAALTTIWAANPQCAVEWMGLELNPVVSRQALATGAMRIWPPQVQQICQVLAAKGYYGDRQFQGTLHFGDARQTIQTVIESGFLADAIFLDPFSPPRCPQLWTVEFLQRVSQCLAPAGILVTYSAAGAVRTALHLAGLTLGSTAPVGRKSPGTLAQWQNVPTPLTAIEQSYLNTRAGIPYRDPFLDDSPETIRQHRHQEQQNSNLMSSSQWRKQLKL